MKKHFIKIKFIVPIALLLGISVPALLSLSILSNERSHQIEKDLEIFITNKAEILAHNLSSPVWNMDRPEMQSIISSAMTDEQIISVSVLDENGSNLAQMQRAFESAKLISKTRKIFQEVDEKKQEIGRVEVIVTDAFMQKKLNTDKNLYGAILISQIFASVSLIGLIVFGRVLNPIKKLTSDAKTIQGGDFHQKIQVIQDDEIGILAASMELMRSNLKSIFEKQAAILNNIPAGVIFIRYGRIEYINKAGKDILSPSGEEITGTAASQFRAEPSLSPIFFAKQGEVLNLRRLNGEIFPAEVYFASVGAEPLEVQAMWVVIDVTLRVEAEKKLDRLAFYDSVTNLPNRNLFLDRLQSSISTQKDNDHVTVVLVIEIFSLGLSQSTVIAAESDAIYAEYSRRLLTSAKADQTLARIGGDRFALISSLKSKIHGERIRLSESVALTVMEVLSQEDSTTHTIPPCMVSIGINLVNTSTLTAEEALMQAELAMIKARDSGRNTYRFFSSDIQEIANQRNKIASELRLAIKDKQFLVCYQPQVDHHGLLIGAEALIRWRHPEKEVISPAVFIPVAEAVGLIGEIGQYVLQCVCSDLKEWQTAGLAKHITISINVSSQEFSSEFFIDRFLRVIEQSRIDPKFIKVEITESLLIENIEDVSNKLKQLKRHGLSISLDDFGTGYASLSYLSRLPIDQIKIDQSFVKDMLNDQQKADITRAIIKLGESLGISVIAEGVEAQNVVNELMKMGCFLYQGYWYGRPVPAEEFTSVLTKVFPASDLLQPINNK